MESPLEGGIKGGCRTAGHYDSKVPSCKNTAQWDRELFKIVFEI